MRTHVVWLGVTDCCETVCVLGLMSTKMKKNGKMTKNDEQ